MAELGMLNVTVFDALAAPWGPVFWESGEEREDRENGRQPETPWLRPRTPAGLFGHVADGFDVVAIWVADEGTVVVRVVLGPDARLMEHVGVSIDRGLEERPHGAPVGCRERDMRLAEALAGGPRANPELWAGRHAEADGIPKIHHAPPADRSEHGVVERSARGYVSALDGKMIQHEAILADPAPARPQDPAGGVSGVLRRCRESLPGKRRTVISVAQSYGLPQYCSLATNAVKKCTCTRTCVLGNT